MLFKPKTAPQFVVRRSGRSSQPRGEKFSTGTLVLADLSVLSVTHHRLALPNHLLPTDFRQPFARSGSLPCHSQRAP